MSKCVEKFFHLPLHKSFLFLFCACQQRSTWVWSYGATVARRIPDPKVGGSNPSSFTCTRANGLGVWFSLWVREVGGSNPPWPPFFFSLSWNEHIKNKKLLVGESNPGRPRDRRKCYQLHQPGRGYNRIRTGDRRICNPMLYHWAMHPLV